MRKTYEVEKIKEMANQYFASDASTPDGREAVSAILDVVLFDSGNYRGFRYLDVGDDFLPAEGAGSKVAYL